MILRRLAAHLKQQQWTGVLIELVIVVVGVFFGLQVQAWATASAEQRRADVLLQQLRGDLDNERNLIHAYVEYQQATAAYARTAITGLESPEAVDPPSWVASIYQASQVYSTSSNRATFDEMKSTGAIDLIRNARLRVMLIGYYSYDWSQSSLMKAEAPYRELVRSILPYGIQKAIKRSCGDLNEAMGNIIVTRLPKACHLDLPAEDIARVTERLRATPGLLPALTYQLSLLETNIETMEPNQQQLADVIAAAGTAAP